MVACADKYEFVDDGDPDKDGSADRPCSVHADQVHRCAGWAIPHGRYPYPHECECGSSWVDASTTPRAALIEKLTEVIIENACDRTTQHAIKVAEAIVDEFGLHEERTLLNEYAAANGAEPQYRTRWVSRTS